MSDFEVIEELRLPRNSRLTGEPERLVIQLTRAGGRPYVSLIHFWFKAADGKFYPPGKDKTRILLRADDAPAVIAMLQKLIELKPAPSVVIDRSKPPRGGTWVEAGSGIIDIEQHRDRLGKP